MPEAKQSPEIALTLTPARDGGYVVHTRQSELAFAGSLTQCLEYMARHFGGEGKVTSHLRPVP
jgi:hypothetical protein